MRYSIDTSAIIEGWRRLYPPDVFPAVWDHLDELIDEGNLRATEEVLKELEKKDDEVHAWAKSRPDLFVKIDEEIQNCVISLLKDHKKLIDTRAGRSGADPFVIALAKIRNSTVVTEEHKSNSPLRRPHIPDVCAAQGVAWISLLQLLRQEGWVFRG